MRVIFAAALLLWSAFADELTCEDWDTIEEAQKYCGKQTAVAAKCLTPCFQEAQGCFKKVGTVILDIQNCMLALDTEERSRYCNSCITQQIDHQCDKVFECIRERNENGEKEFKIENFDGFKRFCKAQSDKGACTRAGCHYNKRGCSARHDKVDCKRVRDASVCNGIPGCSLRKKQKIRGEGRKSKICKGTPKWDAPERKESRGEGRKDGGDGGDGGR